MSNIIYSFACSKGLTFWFSLSETHFCPSRSVHMASVAAPCLFIRLSKCLCLSWHRSIVNMFIMTSFFFCFFLVLYISMGFSSEKGNRIQSNCTKKKMLYKNLGHRILKKAHILTNLWEQVNWIWNRRAVIYRANLRRLSLVWPWSDAMQMKTSLIGHYCMHLQPSGLWFWPPEPCIYAHQSL